MANINLGNAKKAKNDEFYTQYSDIQKEIEAYLEYNPDVFRKKVVYCNCDDPYESNFFRYFVLNFKKLGLKQLITTSYKPSPVANTGSNSSICRAEPPTEHGLQNGIIASSAAGAGIASLPGEKCSRPSPFPVTHHCPFNMPSSRSLSCSVSPPIVTRSLLCSEI
jgi:hypothetical protein